MGDISLNGVYRQRSFTDVIPWSNVPSFWQDCDLRIGNLESPITLAPRFADSKFALRANDNALPILSKSNFDLLGLSNNHAMDFGWSGLNDTINALDSIGVPHVGAGANIVSASSPKIIEVNDSTVAVVAFCDVEQTSPLYATDDQPGVTPLDESSLELVHSLEAKADWVIVQLHWGNEMSQMPAPSQRELARKFVSAGASVIVGHHPHVLQPMEIIDDVPVYYSLGNFAFSNEFWRGQNASGESFVDEYTIHPLAQQSGVASLQLSKSSPPVCHFTPTEFRSDGVISEQPNLHAEWDALCSAMDVEHLPHYEAKWKEEDALAVARRAFQYESRSLQKRLRLKAFQFGLIRQA